MRPPLLFVHGAFGRAAHFDAWRDYFRAAGYAGRAVDLPGHNPPDEALLKTATLADYLAAVGDAAAKFDRPPVVVGHSLGGLLALMLAAEGGCAGAVLAATPAPGFPPYKLGVLPHVLPALGVAIKGLPVTADPTAVRALATHDLSSAESEEIVSQTGMESGLVLRKLAFANTTVDYAAIRCPVLCLSGGKDRLIPAYATRRIVAASMAESLVFPAQGHWLIAGSLTGTVAAAVRKWLGRHFGS